MRQAVMVSPGKIEFRDIPVPRPGDDQVSREDSSNRDLRF